MTDATTENILALARKATQGEWRVVYHIGPKANRIVAGDGKNIHTTPVVADWNGIPDEKNRAYIAAAHPAAIIAMHERHRAEVERLTRERDEARNAAFKEGIRAGEIESALAAERKRVGELEKPLYDMIVAAEAGSIDSPEIGDGQDIPIHRWHDEWLYHARAALAGGKP